MDTSASQKCIIIGASHAGVNTAFSLRKEGWQGEIRLIDSDPELPYHRPPLSKSYLTNVLQSNQPSNTSEAIQSNCIKSKESYDKENIKLTLGNKVTELNKQNQTVTLDNGLPLSYDKLVITSGASAIVPPIAGLNNAQHVFTLRTAKDVDLIRQAITTNPNPNVVIIGGGYIGLETAASMKKLGANVTVLERESRILARVTAPEMSEFFQQLHADNGVDVLTEKNVTEISNPTDTNDVQNVICSDGERFPADIIIIGVGVRVNTELAIQAQLDIENGIKVNEFGQSSDDNIYAVGDCTFHHNPHYDRYIRLESVQNAVDQAKVVAASICSQSKTYDTIPWFWSDQYDVKLQMVGLSQGYDNVVKRIEAEDTSKFSVWYFKGDELLSVDAVNNAKAYVIGTKFIKANILVDKSKLADPSIEFKPANLLP